MKEIIEKRIAECISQAERYQNWLNILRVPNLVLIGIGSLLVFAGGTAILVNELGKYAGYMALSGGALTGFHSWLGCETHQQSCKIIKARYLMFKVKYEALNGNIYKKEEMETRFNSLEESYAEFVASIDANPWI
jgi:hypothetical protein